MHESTLAIQDGRTGPKAHHHCLQKATDEPFWKDIVPHFRQLSSKELDIFPGHRWTHGWKYTTVICDSQLYMQYLQQQFVQVCVYCLYSEQISANALPCSMYHQALSPGCKIKLMLTTHVVLYLYRMDTWLPCQRLFECTSLHMLHAIGICTNQKMCSARMYCKHIKG